MELVGLARRVNDGQVGLAIRTIQKALGGLEGVPVLVLGLTYRDGVKELAYSRAMPLIERLRVPRRDRVGLRPAADRRPRSARMRRDAMALGRRRAAPGRSCTQTADPRFRDLDFGWFPDAEVLFDGRNSAARRRPCPSGVAYHGVGRARPRTRAAGRGRDG